MQDEALNPATLSAMAGAAALSLVAAFYVIQRYLRGEPLLEYEPRRRVPWGPLVVVIPLFFLAINLLPLVLSGETATDQAADSQQFVYGNLITSLLLIAFVVIAMAWLLGERKADREDLGLPANPQQLGRDANIGFVACLFALLPTFALNAVLVKAFESDQQHPLIEQLLEERSPLLMIIAFLSAVIAAPLFEEFTFRVLLQGWLEKLEDERLDYAATLREPAEVITELAEADGESLAVDPEMLAADSRRPSHGWIPALPHGWTPIVISAVVFGLAHVGHGVAPIPLMLLGVVLGYLYQRTHRLAPCVAAHALFNAYSLLLLWLQLEQG